MDVLKILLIHGFREWAAGGDTVDLLSPHLKPHISDMDSADYGYHWLIRVRFWWGHKKDIRRIALALLTTNVVVSFSNGVNYRSQAMEMAHKMDPDKTWIVFDISGAIDSDHEYPEYCTHVFVYATPHDRAVLFARWLRFDHPWGDQGRVGYKGSRKDVVTWFNLDAKSHSGWWKGEQVKVTGDKIMSDLESL